MFGLLQCSMYSFVFYFHEHLQVNFPSTYICKPLVISDGISLPLSLHKRQKNVSDWLWILWNWSHCNSKIILATLSSCSLCEFTPTTILWQTKQGAVCTGEMKIWCLNEHTHTDIGCLNSPIFSKNKFVFTLLCLSKIFSYTRFSVCHTYLPFLI